MAASFLQYCAMCEKQITTPSNRILYCSQACRRKDAAKPISASRLPPSPIEPPSSSGNNSAANSRPVSPHRTPITTFSTSHPTSPTTPTIRIPIDQHAHKPDLDPTEWKPKSSPSANSRRRPGMHTHTSEAYRYLASFHARNMMCTEGGDDATSAAYHQAKYHYSSGASTLPIVSSMPSLSNTPSTVSSGSYETAAAAGSVDGGGGGYAYDFCTRPLQARCNPLYSVGAGVQVEELVTPFVPPKVGGRLAGNTVAEGQVGMEDFWGKKTLIKGSAGKGVGQGLGRLISEKGL